MSLNSTSSPSPHSGSPTPASVTHFGAQRIAPGQQRMSNASPPRTQSVQVRSASTLSRSSQPFPSTSPQAMRGMITRGVTSPMSASPPTLSPFNRVSPSTLRSGNTIGNADDSLSHHIEEATFRLTQLSDTIARARSGLVQELVEVFSVVEVRTLQLSFILSNL